MACNRLQIVVSVIGVLFLMGCEACQLKINGICYDRPRASNPPISARFEAIDADTGKPLPGVMISFYWKSFLRSGRPDQCMRNVIGATDAYGKFSNTAKDGSWMFSEVQSFKAGWERVYFDRLIGQTYISHEYQLNVPDIGMYPAWENNLRRLGYSLDTKTMGPIYRKSFELGAEYDKIMTAEWQPEGLRTYWVKMRGFPSDLLPDQIGTQCFNRQLGKTDPNAELVGYDLPKFKRDNVELERTKHALQAICDAKWDSVPASYDRTPTGKLLAFGGVMSTDLSPDKPGPLSEYYSKLSHLNYEYTRPLTHDERTNFCAFAYNNLGHGHE